MALGYLLECQGMLAGEYFFFPSLNLRLTGGGHGLHHGINKKPDLHIGYEHE
jgi:hypothetical protein